MRRTITLIVAGLLTAAGIGATAALTTGTAAAIVAQAEVGGAEVAEYPDDMHWKEPSQ